MLEPTNSHANYTSRPRGTTNASRLIEGEKRGGQNSKVFWPRSLFRSNQLDKRGSAEPGAAAIGNRTPSRRLVWRELSLPALMSSVTGFPPREAGGTRRNLSPGARLPFVLDITAQVQQRLAFASIERVSLLASLTVTDEA